MGERLDSTGLTYFWGKIKSYISGKIVDNLTSTSTTDALSANQGRVLNGKLNPSISSITMNTSRAELVSGGCYEVGGFVVVAFKFKALQSLTNSPFVATLPVAAIESAVSCIDITSGITSSITGAVPAGVNTSTGRIYVKEIVTDHIYAVTGIYPKA